MGNTDTTPVLSPQEQALLEQLVDIDLPSRIGFWPPSITLVLLIFCLSLMTVGFALLIYRRYKKNRYRRTAKKKLQEIQNADVDNFKKFTSAHALLKRVYFSTAPASHHIMANKWGLDFYQELSNSIASKGKTEFNSYASFYKQWELSHYANQPLNDEMLEAFYSFASSWISLHSSKNMRVQAQNAPLDFSMATSKEFQHV